MESVRRSSWLGAGRRAYNVTMTQLCGSISVVSLAVESLDYGVRAAPVMDTSGLRAQALGIETDQQFCFHHAH